MGSYTLNFKYILSCNRTECIRNNKDYLIACGEFFCAKSKEACDQLNRIRSLINSMIKLPKDKAKYISFYNQIENCPPVNLNEFRGKKGDLEFSAH